MTTTLLPGAERAVPAARTGNTRATRLENQAMATAFLAFSALFVAAQFLHPNPFAGAEPMDGAAFLEAFHNRPLLHLGHLFEFFCGALLIVPAVHFHGLVRPRFPGLALMTLIMAATGAVMLVGNKAGICLSASAFDTLPEPQLLALVPGLDALVSRQGNMAVLSLLPLLPLGFAVFGVLLWRARQIPRFEAGCLVLGSLLLVNPGIQAMNTLGAIVLALAFVPYGVSMLRNRA